MGQQLQEDRGALREHDPRPVLRAHAQGPLPGAVRGRHGGRAARVGRARVPLGDHRERVQLGLLHRHR